MDHGRQAPVDRGARRSRGRFLRTHRLHVEPEAFQGCRRSSAPGASDSGFRFTIENCTGSFLLGSDPADFIKTGRRAKELAREAKRPDFKTYGLFTIVPGETDKDAQARVDHYNAGVDTVALDNQTREYSGDKSLKQNTMANRFIAQGNERWSMTKAAVIGSPATIARKLAEIVHGADLDGITVIVPDFIDDLKSSASKRWRPLPGKAC